MLYFFVDRDDFVTNGVVRRVQGDRQRNVDHIAEFIQRRHHAGGRQGYTTLGKAKAEIVEHDFHRRNDVVEVQQRLAHAHHYYVGNGTHAGGLHRADDLRRAPDLADNFGYPQVAVKAPAGRWSRICTPARSLPGRRRTGWRGLLPGYRRSRRADRQRQSPI